MKMSWRDRPYVTLIELTNGDVLTFPSALWNRTGSDVMNSSIFDVINDYWSTARKEDIVRIENVYRKIHTLFDTFDGYKGIGDEVYILVNELLSVYQWDRFRLWCMLHGKLETDIGIKDSLDPKDKPAITYFTEEHNDLLVLSVLLKSIIPVWGMFHSHMDKELGKIKLLTTLLGMIRTTSISALPVWNKLETHVENFADDRIKTVGFSLLEDIGTEEIPSYLLASALVKKIVIFNGRTHDKHIVRNMFHALEQVCNSIDKKKPIGKKSRDDATGKDLSITDQYKMVQPISPATTVFLEHYISNYIQMSLDIDPTIPVKLVKRCVRETPTDVSRSELHTPIIAAIISDVMNKRGIKLVDYKSLLILMGISQAMLLHWELKTLAVLLVTNPVEPDLYTVTLTGSKVKGVKNLSNDLNTEISNLYPNINTVNPGIALINRLAKFINKNDWGLPTNTIDNFKDEMALLLIRTNKG